MKKDIQHIAIVRLSALGDIINSAVVLQFIQQSYPDAKITWIVEEAFGGILHRSKELENIITLNLKKFKKQKSLALLKTEYTKLKRAPSFDIVIDMQGLIKSAVVSRILSRNSHGFDKNSTRESAAALFYKSTSHISYESNVIFRNAKVVSDALNIDITPEMLLHKKAVFDVKKRYELPQEKKNIAFVIGASWPSKIYPKELVAQVCQHLDANIYLIWGSKEERERAEFIAAHADNAKLAPCFSLEELVDFISSVDLLIGNDTGPTHLAWAQNIASLTLLGPTTSRMTGESPKNRVLKSPSQVNLLKINKNDFSIKEIAPQEVAKTAKELLNGL